MKVTVNNFLKATQELNALLRKKKPKTFNPEWIQQHSNSTYKYLCKNIRTGSGDVDWDLVTVALERTFQKRWKRYEKKIKPVPYENKEELDNILTKYQNKLYTLTVPLGKADEQIQDHIMIRLVRAAQKGNTLAKEQVIEYVTLIIYEWIESSKYMVKWKGYTYDIENKIQGCIRNYRYSGSFMRYLFKTFQYAARGLRPTLSLDDRFHDGKRRRIDYVIQEEDYSYG